MIDPSTLDLRSLPSVPLKERSTLPEISCIYFAVDVQGTVQYIGRANNLKNRWISHHRRFQLSSIGNIKIAYLAVSDKNLLVEIEKALIEYFSPELNRSEVVVGIGRRKAVTYRLLPEVINAVKYLAFKNGRSENMQAEFMLKIGLLVTNKVDITGFSDREIIEAFEKLAKSKDF